MPPQCKPLPLLLRLRMSQWQQQQQRPPAWYQNQRQHRNLASQRRARLLLLHPTTMERRGMTTTSASSSSSSPLVVVAANVYITAGGDVSRHRPILVSLVQQTQEMIRAALNQQPTAAADNSTTQGTECFPMTQYCHHQHLLLLLVECSCMPTRIQSTIARRCTWRDRRT
jgi:hypothetical protein